MMFDNEQWKSDGNCEICRRKSYCRKTCTARNKAVQRAIGRAIIGSSKKIMGAYASMMVGGKHDYFERKD